MNSGRDIEEPWLADRPTCVALATRSTTSAMPAAMVFHLESASQSAWYSTICGRGMSMPRWNW